MRYGHGRLDAQGHILNKVTLIVGEANQLPGYAADAPASYPFLWNTPQQELVQWNGIVDPNIAVLRNIGEAIGVLAVIDVASDPAKYPSSVRLDNLARLETMITALKAPQWPEHILPKLGALETGKNLF